MFLERPPQFFRRLYKGCHFLIREDGVSRSETPDADTQSDGLKSVYLTFDDGPIPEVTPWVLDMLDNFSIKATFFMVGDNARRHPELVREVLARGHRTGNHTMHHLQGLRTLTRNYLADVQEASRYIPSRLFRPPHGIMRIPQLMALRRSHTVVMYDLVTRDYSRRLTPEDVTRNVRQYTRPGSIIVFHDSLKAWPRMHVALPDALCWLIDNGYEFRLIPYTEGIHDPLSGQSVHDLQIGTYPSTL